VAVLLETSVAMLRALTAKENVHLPATTDLFLEIDQDTEKPVAIGLPITRSVPFFGCTQ
jgi:hypothetical protein